MSLLLLSALLTVSADQQPVNGDTFNFLTYVDASTEDPFGGFWGWTNATSDVVGNIFTYEQSLLFWDKSAPLGIHSGYCIRTDPGLIGWTGTDAPGLIDDVNDNFKQCSWTLTFSSNSTYENNTVQLTARLADVELSRAAIIGGTGRFQGAYGWATFEPEDAPTGGLYYKQELNFTIDLDTYEGVTSSPTTDIPATYSPGSSASPKSTTVRVSNTTVSEIQTGMIAFRERLRMLVDGTNAVCEQICTMRRKFRSTEYVQQECFGCDVVATERDAAVLAWTDDYAHDIHMTVTTKHTQADVNSIIQGNFNYLVAAISPYVMLTSVTDTNNGDDGMPAEEIVAIVLIAVVVIAVVAVFMVLGKKKSEEEVHEPVNEDVDVENADVVEE